MHRIGDVLIHQKIQNEAWGLGAKNLNERSQFKFQVRSYIRSQLEVDIDTVQTRRSTNT